MYLFDHSVRTVVVDMQIIEAEDRIWSLQREYRSALQAAGYRAVIQTRGPIAINGILKKLKPYQLCCRMLDIMNGRKNENFFKENSGRFAREVAVLTEKIQTWQITTPLYRQNIGREINSERMKALHFVQFHEKKPITKWGKSIGTPS